MTVQPLLSVEGLTRDFEVGRDLLGRPLRRLRAVDGVSLDVMAGETLGIVGESGCGKTTLGRLMMRLIEPSAGRISFDGRDISHLARAAMRPLRNEMQIVFQDPYSSLNPRMKVREIIAEPLENAGLGRSEIRARVDEVLEVVRLPADYAGRYPHAFSGGQRQRIGIARALAVRPRLIVCDEAVSALDVSVQAQILNLLAEIQRDTGVALVFISHSLGVIRFLSHRVAVMYLGRIVEQAPRPALFAAPRHPYTAALMRSVPEPGRGRRSRGPILTGDIPSPIDPPPGCPFHTRCPRAEPRCRAEPPALDLAAPGHLVACHFPISGDDGGVA